MTKNQSIFAALRGEKEPPVRAPLYQRDTYSVIPAVPNRTNQNEAMFDVDGNYLGDKKEDSIEDIARRFEADMDTGIKSTVLHANQNHKSLIFIYGTLKKNGNRSSLLRTSEYLGEAVTGVNFDLKRTGQGSRSYDFPILFQNSKFIKDRKYLSRVIGELYRVDNLTLNILDGIENVPKMYSRKPIQIYRYNRDKNFIEDQFTADAYIGNHDYWENTTLYDCEKLSEKAPHLFYPVSRGIVG